MPDDGVLLAVHLDLGAGILAGDDLLALLHGHLDLLAVHQAAGAIGPLFSKKGVDFFGG